MRLPTRCLTLDHLDGTPAQTWNTELVPDAEGGLNPPSPDAGSAAAGGASHPQSPLCAGCSWCSKHPPASSHVQLLAARPKSKAQEQGTSPAGQAASADTADSPRRRLLRTNPAEEAHDKLAPLLSRMDRFVSAMEQGVGTSPSSSQPSPTWGKPSAARQHWPTGIGRVSWPLAIGAQHRLVHAQLQ